LRNALQKETPGLTMALVALSRRSKLALFSRSVSHMAEVGQVCVLGDAQPLACLREGPINAARAA
jgi:hypothetical protein